MMTNVRFFILFLYPIKVTILELLSHTIVQFDPFQIADISSVQHLHRSNITFTDEKIFTNYVKKFEKRDTQNQFFERRDLLNQRIQGNAVPQCPCVIKPGTDKCIAYDSRFQASTIEEALIAFHDVTLDDDSVKFPNGGIINGELLACRTLECQTCAAILLSRIIQVGLVPPDIQLSIPFPSFVDSRYCQRLRFLKSYSVPASPQPSPFMSALIERGLQFAGISSTPNVRFYLVII
ncbi:unnamed protein product [Onchocerca ochengi]|uniref:CMP/dCMP-type deaminase domain-containing protein n=1 Tax=Onchocerca ochengi TaxID=42157 RepID=A0A182EQ84_ONCOC|nr:unnamed protein product [Onchocerca ochengi]